MKKWIVLIAIYLLVGLAAWMGLLGTGYEVQHDGLESLPPGAAGLLGTDNLGRDVLARTLQGVRIALMVGAIAAGLAVGVGAFFGLLGGWYRGVVDGTVLWISGAVAAVPGILLIVAIGSVLGRGFSTVFLAIGLVTWVGIFRTVRGEVLKLRESEFVLAARASGAGAARIFLRHLIPNLGPLLLVQFSLFFVYAVKVEVIVSFLGVGMADEPSWGRMIGHARSDLPQGVWWPLASATVAMFGLVLAVQALTDHLQDRLTPGGRRAADR